MPCCFPWNAAGRLPRHSSSCVCRYGGLVDATPLLIIGSGGHAKVVIDIVTAMGGYEIVGLASNDDDPSRLVAGHRILSGLDYLESLTDRAGHFAMGIGGWTDNKDRRRAYEAAIDAGLQPVTVVHPATSISPSASIGPGCVVFPGAVLNTDASIGVDTIVATNSSIDHESTIGDHVLISAGVTIGARVTIGDRAALAIGCVVASRVKVGTDTLVAAGAVVVDDVPDGAKVYGLPARSREA